MPKAKMDVCDCCYNVSKQLAKKSEFLWHAERYLKDAKKKKHAGCARMWKRIIADERQHVRMLKSAMKKGIC